MGSSVVVNWIGEELGKLGAYSSAKRGEGVVLRFEAGIEFKEMEVGSTAAGAACASRKFWERRSNNE